MSGATPKAIYVDARALQDPSFRYRGIGQHAASLIERLREHGWNGGRPRLVAVTDIARDTLKPEHRRLFDEIITQPRPGACQGRSARPTWFVSLSPMTHDPVWASAFLTDPTVHRTAIFYDLIPLQFPDLYLSGHVARMNYVAALAWLPRYDTFAAISQATARELVDRMAIPSEKVFVTGVAVRRTLEPELAAPDLPHRRRRTIVVAGGGDPRKNPECAIIAHARSADLKAGGVRLAVFGSYPDSVRADLRRLYSEHGGRPGDLTFLPHLTDDDLREVYRCGLVTVVPSRAEGFSIPIVESSAARTPVLASDAGAHPELVRDPAWRFDPDQPEALQGLLERLSGDEATWAQLRDAQAGLWEEYKVERVSERFIDGVVARAPSTLASPAIKRGIRPSIAVLTPLPPAHSGVADYSAATLRPLKLKADLHMFTPTPNARWEDGWSSLQPISAAAFTAGRYDATVSVMGNSDNHIGIFNYLLDYGGACIAHDARQSDFYFHLLGPKRAAAVASLELNRQVSEEEISGWLSNPRTLPTLFLSELLTVASPLIVHSSITRDLIREMYGTEAALLPFAQYRSLRHKTGTRSRRAARKSIGISDDQALIVSFGHVGHDRGADDLVWAIKLLRDWGVDALLTFCGAAAPAMRDRVVHLAESLGVEGSIDISCDHRPEAAYQDYVLAADAAVQLRTYKMGGLSGALNDVIAAGLPAVANAHLAEALGAPDFVRRVSDNLSPVEIAEAVLAILADQPESARRADVASEYAQRHSPEVYAEGLLQLLGLA